MNPTLAQAKRRMLPILKRHEVVRAAVFGSFAHGTARNNSDLDVLVELPRSKSLLDLAALKSDLEEAVGRRVDVVTPRALHPKLRRRILAERVVIW